MQAVRRIAPPAWMLLPETRAVIAALAAGGATPRFVGGCVRDAVLEVAAADIDIATPETPDLVLQRLAQAQIRGIPTGVEHGTVTALSGGHSFEITTLRRDVETFGRHARVAFTDSWLADAARRDFTFNALYADPDGTVYDPTGGLADLSAGLVRFIGDARARVDEDALRILRFFRFYARFGRQGPDAAALAACRDAAPSLETLSGERIAAEMQRLLALAEPVAALHLMAGQGILPHIGLAGARLDRVERLVAAERLHQVAADPWRRLAALLPPAGATAIALNWHLSQVVRTRLSALERTIVPVDNGRFRDGKSVRRALYESDAELFRDRILLALADGAVSDVAPILRQAAQWSRPEFPLRGADALALGLVPGPGVGALLRAVEDWWIAGDFHAGRADCLAELQRRHQPIS